MTGVATASAVTTAAVPVTIGLLLGERVSVAEGASPWLCSRSPWFHGGRGPAKAAWALGPGLRAARRGRLCRVVHRLGPSERWCWCMGPHPRPADVLGDRRAFCQERFAGQAVTAGGTADARHGTARQVGQPAVPSRSRQGPARRRCGARRPVPRSHCGAGSGLPVRALEPLAGYRPAHRSRGHSGDQRWTRLDVRVISIAKGGATAAGSGARAGGGYADITRVSYRGMGSSWTDLGHVVKGR